jgi:cytochrome P450
MLIVTRQPDVKPVLGDNTFSTHQVAWANDGFGQAPSDIGAGGVFEKAITLCDPPDHTRIRRAVMPYFVPSWRLLAQQKAAEPFRGFEDKESVDIIEDFVGAIPTELISSVLGFSLDAHLSVVDAVERAFPADPSRSDAFDEICNLSRALVLDKERAPAEDLASFLAHARPNEKSLSLNEPVALVAVIILGGIDTARALIGSSVLALLDHPNAREPLRAHPTLDSQALDEILRHSGSVVVPVIRFPVRDTEVSGTAVAAGTPVMPCVMSANRDPPPSPRRTGWTSHGPTPALRPGYRIHKCLGAALARLKPRPPFPR